jgi:murein DD-endopeptidase MepM/ murein hydrolase activator NlpD
MHPGIDIRGPYGTPVVAGGDGEVVFAGRDPGYGGLVVVAHPGEIETLYAHLSALYVHAGQTVRRGQPVGAIGATGRATGPHLHYEVRVASVPVDPGRYLVK